MRVYQKTSNANKKAELIDRKNKEKIFNTLIRYSPRNDSTLNYTSFASKKKREKRGREKKQKERMTVQL